MSTRTIARDVLPDGKLVITSRLPESWEPGYDAVALRDLLFGFPVEKRYETMVFPDEASRRDLDWSRYDTPDEATTGHRAMVAKWERPDA